MTGFRRDRISILILFLFLLSIVGMHFLSAEKDPLTCEMDLADWGLDDPSEVGYLSIGVIHKSIGDEILVYDARAKRPVIEQPRKSNRRIPLIEKGVFLCDDFHKGNTNRLGGYFSGFRRAPSESDVTIDRAADGRRSLCFTYIQKSPGFSGFWIHLFDFKQPPVDRIFLDASPFRYITFSIRGEEGGERLMLQVADFNWERKEDSLKIGNVEDFLPSGVIGKDWQRAWVPVDIFPPQIEKDELASLVFLSRGGRGRIYIGDIAFTLKKETPIPMPEKEPGTRSSVHRGMWVWNTKELLGQDVEQLRLAAFCKQTGITEIFLQLPYEIAEKDGKKEVLWDKAEVASLLSRLHSARIKVHALDGDPRFALRQWHSHVLATIRSVIQFNGSVRPEERFDGIRYDNEPYLLPGFAGVQKEAIIEQYLELLRSSKELAGPAGLEFGVDIPFWFDQKNEFFEPIAQVRNRPLTEHILDIVDNIGIMDYRTDAYGADGVIAHAIGELAYASAKGKKVFIGLETTDLPDETIIEFGKAKGPSGIRIKKNEGTKVLLQWIPDIAGAGEKGDYVLYQQKRTSVPAEKLTFAGKSIRELDDVMEKAEREFRKFPGFYGFAVHYYRSFQSLSELKKFPVPFF